MRRLIARWLRQPHVDKILAEGGGFSAEVELETAAAQILPGFDRLPGARTDPYLARHRF